MRTLKVSAPTLLALLLASAQAGAVTIPDSELSLGGVALGDTEATVIQRLGPPNRRVDTGEGMRLDYPGLTVWTGFLEDPAKPGATRQVSELLSTSADACTPAGLCPAQRLSDAFLGRHLDLVLREGGTFLEAPASESSCWLQLTAREGRVLSVRAECQP